MRWLVLLVGLSLGGCSSVPPECAAIAQRCQPHVAAGSATIAQKDCYDNANSVWKPSQCVDNLASCQAACPAPKPDGGL